MTALATSAAAAIPLPRAAGPDRRPLIVGIGGTTRAHSSTERALRLALAAAERGGARVRLFDGPFLAGLPHYAADGQALTDAQSQLVEAVREADAVLLASPGYHGGVSGLVKNALDTLEALRDDARPYLDGRAVGCIATAYGPQAGVAVLAALRSTAHALRGWPTPYGVAINVGDTPLDEHAPDPRLRDQLDLVARQALAFAHAFGAARRKKEARHG